MTYHQERHQRHSIRLKAYDYSQAEAYFITICTHERRSLFGHIVDGQMKLNAYGDVVRDEWTKSAQIRREIVLDQFVVMPNHVHGIVFIQESEDTEGQGGRLPVAPTPGALTPGGRLPVAPTSRAPTSLAPTSDALTASSPRGPAPKSLGSFVVGFKSAVSRRIKDLCGRPGPIVWQRNYFEHVIRDDGDLDIVRQYIANNPMQWDLDENNLDGRGRHVDGRGSRGDWQSAGSKL